MRTIVDTVPTALLVLVVVGARRRDRAARRVGVRRFVPSTRDGFDAEVSSQMIGVVASLFGLLLAFVVVIEFQTFSSAGDNVQTEADDLGAIVRDSYAFGPAGGRIRTVDRRLRSRRRRRRVAADAEGQGERRRVGPARRRVRRRCSPTSPSRPRRWRSTTTRCGTSTRCSRRGATGSTRVAATIFRR